MSVNPTRALVIGGSIAGLLTARVLSDHFDQITIIERDSLPDEADYRKGVPQAHHLHALLIRGQRIMNKMFPGFDDDLLQAGGIKARWGLDGAFYTTGGYTPYFDAKMKSITISRRSVEWVVRQRVAQIDNINFMTQTDVKDLCFSDDGKRVIGVHVQSRVDRERDVLLGDLVVDASGRRSKAPNWLEAQGFDAPEKTIITAHTGYATRWYQLPENHDIDNMIILVQPNPPIGCYRGGGYLFAENNQVVVTLIGANHDYPPTDEQGYMEFMRSLPAPDLYELVQQCEPISPIHGYRKLENQWRHYEKLTHHPENFIAIGDATVAFNPIYGQGMSSAAIQAEALNKVLHKYNPHHLHGMPQQFYKQLPRVLKSAWMISTYEDMRYPAFEGAEKDLQTRIGNRYFDLYAQAMPHDEVLSKGFFEVMNMLRSSTSLMQPKFALRVLWHNFRRPRNAMATLTQEMPRVSVN